MKASTDKRDGLPPPEAADDADPISGREWTTGGTDLQYACIFDLYDKNPDGSVVPIQRKCDSADKSACDCDGKKDTPLCAPRGSDVQVKGKAYPTRRELMVAKELGDHAIVASLCPRQLTAPDADDYGYRPAVNAIADALADQIHGACVPRALERDGDGAVPCLVMALLPDPGPDSDCQTRYGLANPPPDVLARFRDRLAAEEGEAARALPVCLVPEIQAPDGPSCLDDESAMGFCYVDRDPVSKCSYELLFTKATQRIAGARFQMQCIQVSSE